MEYSAQRITVRPIQEKDSAGLARLLTDETVGRTYMLPEFGSGEEVAAFCARLVQLSARQDRYICAICLEDQFIGMVNDTEVAGSSIELGYAILPEHHNRGYGTEMLRGAIRYLLGQGFTEIVTGAFAENRASIRIMEKSGMQLSDRRDTVAYRGKNRDCVYYSYRSDK